MNLSEDRSWAKAYHISFSDITEGTAFAQRNLNQASELFQFLEVFAESLKSPAPQVTGSLFVKRYCLLIAGAMHSFIRRREAVDLTPERIKLVWLENTLRFVIDNSEVPSFQTGLQDEDETRERYFDHVFAEQAGPMLKQIAQITRIDEATLWGNLSFSLAYWKNDWLQSSSLTEPERERIEKDYSELTETFRRKRFPDMSFNPLMSVFRNVENPLEPAKPIMVRSKCCLYYCLSETAKHCYTCPRITDDKRIENYGEIHGITKTKETVKVSK
ncbi:MAG: hypothetical protein K0S39_5657 [Paenibacillus sp.]|jgi:ferric iron reductase protein FhuF|nr:hypothetical protein [Paenibacillus sp.]